MVYRKRLLRGYKITFVVLGVGMLLLYGSFAIYNFIAHTRAVTIAKRPGVAKSIEKVLSQLDPKAFTKDGMIKTYEIHIEESNFTPINWLAVYVEINNNPDLYVNAQIKYDTLNEEYETGPLTISERLSKLLRGE